MIDRDLRSSPFSRLLLAVLLVASLAACTSPPPRSLAGTAIRREMSPNFDARRANLVVLHHTSDSTLDEALATLTNPERKVSAHYLIGRDGEIVQMVEEKDRAWHAGVSWWRGARDINARSIGIELVNPGHEWGYRPFPEAQMNALIDLAQGILARHPIPRRNVVGHSDVAPTRKIDPGEKFPWNALAAQRIGHWVAPVPVDAADPGLPVGSDGALVAEVQTMLKNYGYAIEPTGSFDLATEFVVKAFQRHFRPARVDGRIDHSTIATLQALSAALPRETMLT